MKHQVVWKLLYALESSLLYQRVGWAVVFVTLQRPE